ncbi:hypothetical protein V6N11_046123 [Hibiscus sabdariffa]|uniref:At2g35280-like TPR domain-containing protein n=1 Tax=Hibiscus sabdariffa TaxID=183260 RepID=A0ABR1Z868_9ROSI
MVEKGHVRAIYTYGIILICFGGELREKALQIVSSLNLVNSSKSKKSLRTIAAYCQSKTKRFFSMMWQLPVALAGSEHVYCNCDQAWETSSSQDPRETLTSNEINHGCHSCFWNHEAMLFSWLVVCFLHLKWFVVRVCLDRWQICNRKGRVFVEDEPMVRGEAGEDADMSAELVVVLNKERVVALFDNDDIIAPEIEGYC